MLSVVALLTSCNNKETTSYTQISLTPSDLQGTIVDGEEATLTADETYTLNGALIVADGGKLTIEAGARIEASENTDSTVRYIAVEQGGKIYIEGTAANPVVMTSGKSSPAKSDWGGLVICGKAPINTGGDAGTASAEVSGLTYGGASSNDSSGSIEYLIIEYTGYAYTATKEFNGVSLFGVGRGTKFEYVHARHNGDDGIEFFGGTVNGKYLISSDSDDDGIDFADGWAGTGQYWYVYNTAKASIEGSNNGNDFAQTPLTDATLRNISLVKGTLANSEHAMYLKEGTGKWDCSNIYISGTFSKGLKVKSETDDAATYARILAGDVTFNPIQFDVATEGFTKSEYAGTNTTYLTEGTNTGAGSGATFPTWASFTSLDEVVATEVVVLETLR